MVGNNWSIEGIEKKDKQPTKTKAVVRRSSPPPPPMTQEKAERLMEILVTEHQFDLVKEIVTLYNEAKDLENVLESLKIRKSIIKDLIKYCFPVISAESGTKEKPRVTFNFNLQQNNTPGGDGLQGVLEAEYEEDE